MIGQNQGMATRERWYFQGRSLGMTDTEDHYVWKRRANPGEDYSATTYFHPVSAFWPNPHKNVTEPEQATQCHGTMTDDELLEAWRRGEPVDEEAVDKALSKYCGRGPCWLEGGHEGKCIPG